jgi:glutathione S-transferase
VEAAPILYSFCRCPYAIRARLALAAAGLRPGHELEMREVSLRARPPELREASPKATVPVLVLPDGTVLEESLAIMRWALQRHDPPNWLRRGGGAAGEQERAAIEALVGQNDGAFKHHLDRFKYADRYPGESSAEHRRAGLAILRGWNSHLEGGGWLLGDHPSLADWALLPFVRQFRLADPAGFDAEPDLEALRFWLARFKNGPELAAVMAPPWAERRPWRSPGWLYHLALRPEWQAARVEGIYRRSTRGRSLEEVGFIHLSAVHQVEATAERFYADLSAGELLLLTVDASRLADLGLPVRWEPAPGSGELFPHLYGALPLEAVLLVEGCGP